jgi:hypothetical protein
MQKFEVMIDSFLRKQDLYLSNKKRKAIPVTGREDP